nr:MAG TPA: hypothetical protein [Caudoviricetes sp.]DAU20199.1 MAG TPA: hypothetical protein [Bacteriophage sp.]DAY07582.1 MAG TPA: hypothetical protein [Caudoviricetes sp.]
MHHLLYYSIIITEKLFACKISNVKPPRKIRYTYLYSFSSLSW